MEVAEAAPAVGLAASLAVLFALVTPYVFVPDPGTGLAIYYASGPFGAGVLGFFALLEVVVLLATRQGRTDPDLAAGVALVVGLALLALAILWASAVDVEVVFSFPADWMGYHRWVVVVLAAVVPASAAVYAREVV